MKRVVDEGISCPISRNPIHLPYDDEKSHILSSQASGSGRIASIPRHNPDIALPCDHAGYAASDFATWIPLIEQTLYNVSAVHSEGKAKFIKHILAAYTAKKDTNTTKAFREQFTLQLLNHPSQNGMKSALDRAPHGHSVDLPAAPVADHSRPSVRTGIKGVIYDPQETKLIITYCGQIFHYNSVISATFNGPRESVEPISLRDHTTVDAASPAENHYEAYSSVSSSLLKAIENLYYVNVAGGVLGAPERLIQCRCEKCQLLKQVPFALVLTPNISFDGCITLHGLPYELPRLDTLRYMRRSVAAGIRANVNARDGQEATVGAEGNYAAAPIGAAGSLYDAPYQSLAEARRTEAGGSIRSAASSRHGAAQRGLLPHEILTRQLRWPPEFKGDATPLFDINTTAQGAIPIQERLAYAKHRTFCEPRADMRSAYIVKIASHEPHKHRTKPDAQDRTKVAVDKTLSYTEFMVIVDNCLRNGQLNQALVMHSCGCCMGLSHYIDTYADYRLISSSEISGKEYYQISFACPVHGEKVTVDTTSQNESLVIFHSELLKHPISAEHGGGHALITNNYSPAKLTLLDPFVAQENAEVLKVMLSRGGAVANTIYARDNTHQYDSAGGPPSAGFDPLVSGRYAERAAVRRQRLASVTSVGSNNGYLEVAPAALDDALRNPHESEPAAGPTYFDPAPNNPAATPIQVRRNVPVTANAAFESERLLPGYADGRPAGSSLADEVPSSRFPSMAAPAPAAAEALYNELEDVTAIATKELSKGLKFMKRTHNLQIGGDADREYYQFTHLAPLTQQHGPHTIIPMTTNDSSPAGPTWWQRNGKYVKGGGLFLAVVAVAGGAIGGALANGGGSGGGNDKTGCVGGLCPNPSAGNSNAPTFAPSFAPSSAPSFAPSFAPTFGPTSEPTAGGTFAPTGAGLGTFSPTAVPSLAPTTSSPSGVPTFSPSTGAPTGVPTFSPFTEAPTDTPTVNPTTGAPTGATSTAAVVTNTTRTTLLTSTTTTTHTTVRTRPG